MVLLLWRLLLLPWLLPLVLRLRLCNKPAVFQVGPSSVQGTDTALLSFRRRASLVRCPGAAAALLLFALWTPVASSLLFVVKTASLIGARCITARRQLV